MTHRGWAPHAATLLPTGQVLITGGSSPFPAEASATAELYDPTSETFTPMNSMSQPRSNHTATLLSNGHVLVVGGVTSETIPTGEKVDRNLNSAELWIPSRAIATTKFSSTTFTVNSANDADDGTCDATHCSLREAINTANAHAGADTIAFNISGEGPHTIQPTSALPDITDPVVIDGYTQSGASPNTNPVGQGLNTVLKIELDGTNAGALVNGLTITARSSTVRGLTINRFTADGIRLETNGSNVIAGNFIGTDVTGTMALGNSSMGVHMVSAANNTIGGKTPEAVNLISGNGSNGVMFNGPLTVGNVVQGNLVGTDVSGAVALGNNNGVHNFNGSNNTIGGTTAAARNVISGNAGAGVSIFSSAGSGATGNLVQGNFIGTDISGSGNLGNSTGVLIPNPPKDTDGRREGSGRGWVRELQGRWPGVLG